MYFKHDERIFLRYKARSLDKINLESHFAASTAATAHLQQVQQQLLQQAPVALPISQNKPRIKAFTNNLTHQQQLQQMAMMVLSPHQQYNLQNKIASLNPSEELNPTLSQKMAESYRHGLLSPYNVPSSARNKWRASNASSFGQTVPVSPTMKAKLSSTGTSMAPVLNEQLPSIMEFQPTKTQHYFLTQPSSPRNINALPLVDFTALKDRLKRFSFRMKKIPNQAETTKHNRVVKPLDESENDFKSSPNSLMMKSVSTQHSINSSMASRQPADLFQKLKSECSQSISESVIDLAREDKNYLSFHESVQEQLECGDNSARSVEILKNIVNTALNYESAANLVSRCNSMHSDLDVLNRTFTQEKSKIDQTRELLTCRARINHIPKRELDQEEEEDQQYDVDKETTLAEKIEYENEINKYRTMKSPLYHLDQRPKLLKRLLKIRKLRILDAKTPVVTLSHTKNTLTKAAIIRS